MAPRLELPPDQVDTDFVIQIWDLFGTRVYLSRPGLPMINQTALGYADVRVRGEPWRTYGLQTVDGVIQIAQPERVREQLARGAALRVVIPLLLLLPVLGAAIVGVVRSGLLPLQRIAIEVQRRDVHSLTPIAVAEPAAGSRAPGARAQSPVDPSARGISSPARLHRRRRPRAALAVDGGSTGAAAAR